MSRSENQHEIMNILDTDIRRIPLGTRRFVEYMQNIIDQSIDDIYLQTAINQSLTESINNRQENISLSHNWIKYSDLPEENKNDKKCMICMQDFNQDDKVVNNCHIFHYECINEWVKYKPECPTCRKKIEINVAPTNPQVVELMQCEQCGENYECGQDHECEIDEEDDQSVQLEEDYEAEEVEEELELEEVEESE